tara:strand:+ start:900 stop:2132 length:1233 start_codon:yes stop_codon:yes gene_type:complete
VHNKRVAFYSEKQYQCGASIAALRVAMEMPKAAVSVDYHYDMPSPGLKRGNIFKTINFTRVVAGHSDYAIETLKAAEIAEAPNRDALRQDFFEQHLRTRMKSGDFDAAHFHNYSGSRGTLVDIANNKPLVWTMHDTSPVTGYHYRTYDPDNAPLEYKAKTTPAGESFWEALRGKPFALTAPSVWLTEYAKASVPDHITVRHIPNAVPETGFYPMDKALARAIIGIPPGKLYMLFFAGTGAWKRKNFEILARAFNKVPDLPVHAIVVGGVADTDLMRDPRFSFMNSFDPVLDAAKIVALYNAVDAFCITSLIDNLPNTVLEAISCGRPVIGARVGGVTDMVKDGVNGWLFDPRDADSAASALKRFSEDAPRLDEMGQMSLKIARDGFQQSDVAGAFRSLYEELAEIHQKRN